MSGLLQWSGAAVTAADTAGAVYDWAVCGQELPQSMQCGASDTGGELADPPPGGELVAATRRVGTACKTIGTWRDATGLPMPCYQRDATNPKQGIKCHLYAGDHGTSGESLIIDFLCRPEGALPPTVVSVGANTYHATLTGPEACALSASLLVPILVAAGGALALALAALAFCKLRRIRQRRGETSSEDNKPRAGLCERLAASRAGGSSSSSSRPFVPPPNADSMSPAELRRQLLADSDDEEAAPATPRANASSSSAPMHSPTSDAYTPFTPPNPADVVPASAVPAATDEAERAGRAAAAAISGLDALMAAAGLEDRLAAAGLWCTEHGWCSVAHLRSGGTRAAEAFVTALRLKSDGGRARKLKRELKKDVWAWDVHAAAARSASKRPEL